MVITWTFFVTYSRLTWWAVSVFKPLSIAIIVAIGTVHRLLKKAFSRRITKSVKLGRFNDKEILKLMKPRVSNYFTSLKLFLKPHLLWNEGGPFHFNVLVPEHVLLACILNLLSSFDWRLLFKLYSHHKNWIVEVQMASIYPHWTFFELNVWLFYVSNINKNIHRGKMSHY